jgi:hypothetical protein
MARRFLPPIGAIIICVLLLISDLLSYLNSGWYDFSESAKMPFYIVISTLYVQSGMLSKENVKSTLKAIFYTYFALVLVYAVFNVNLFLYTRIIEQNFNIFDELDFSNSDRWAIGNPNTFGITVISLIMIKRVLSGQVSWGDFLFGLPVLFLGKSRTCIISGLLYLNLCQIGERNWFRRIWILIAGSVGVLFMFNIFEENFSRLSAIGNVGDQRRLAILEITQSQWREILFVGMGSGSLQEQIYIQTLRKSSGESVFLEAVYTYGFFLSSCMFLALAGGSKKWWREIMVLVVLGSTNSINGCIIVVILCVLMLNQKK